MNLIVLAVIVMWVADHIIMRIRLDRTRAIASRATERAAHHENMANIWLHKMKQWASEHAAINQGTPAGGERKHYCELCGVLIADQEKQ